MSQESTDFRLVAEGLPYPAFVAVGGEVIWANSAWSSSPVGRPLQDVFDAQERAVKRTLDMARSHPSVQVAWSVSDKSESFQWTLRLVADQLFGLASPGQRRVVSDREELLLMGERMTQTGFWTINTKTWEAWWSDEVYRIHGYQPSDVPSVFQLGLEHYVPEDRARVQGIIDYALASGEPYEFEATLERADGARVRVQGIGRPHRDPVTGEVDRINGAFRDVTTSDRTRRLQELEMFARVAAHDLREPARTLRSFVELLFDDLDLPPDRDAHRHAVLRSSRRLLDLIDSVRDFARSGADLELSPLALDEVLQEVSATVMPEVAHAHGSLSVVTTDARVLAHPRALKQLLLNLLRNAVRYRHPDRPVDVRVEVDDSGAAIVLSIIDNGRGIDGEHADYVFQPFRRVHADQPGSGVGLAVARRLAEQCRGRLRLGPSPGEHGTCMQLTLLRG